MSAFERIHTEWLKDCEIMNKTPGFARMLSKEITVEHYKMIMRQIFHHSRENPQIQALAAVYFRGPQRKMVKPFFKHAISEIGHDQLALNDLETLGEDTSNIPFEKPLPSTVALLSYAFYEIQFRNPVGYLGYLFHLEFMPTKFGSEYVQAFSSIGVPEKAMSFIFDHTTVDIGHNKLMEMYVNDLVKTEDDIQSVIFAARLTSRLYAEMVRESIAVIDEVSRYMGSQTIDENPRNLMDA